jgi:hypothetical protein
MEYFIFLIVKMIELSFNCFAIATSTPQRRGDAMGVADGSPTPPSYKRAMASSCSRSVYGCKFNNYQIFDYFSSTDKVFVSVQLENENVYHLLFLDGIPPLPLGNNRAQSEKRDNC